MTKLVDQLITEHLHHIAEKCEQDPALATHTTSDIVARSLLSEIADEAHPVFILKALSALGVAGSLEELGERFAAVRAVRAEAFKAAGIDIAAEYAARQRQNPLRQFLDTLAASIEKSIERKAAADTTAASLAPEAQPFPETTGPAPDATPPAANDEPAEAAA